MDILVFSLGVVAIFIFLRIWLQNLAETDSGVTTTKNGSGKIVTKSKGGPAILFIAETSGFGYYFNKDTGLREKGDMPEFYYGFFMTLFFWIFGVYPIFFCSVLNFDIKLIDEKKNERTEKAHSIILKGIYNVLAKELEAMGGANPEDVLLQANNEFLDLKLAIGNHWYAQLQDSLLSGLKNDANEMSMEEMLGAQKDAIYDPDYNVYYPIDGDDQGKINIKDTTDKIKKDLEMSKEIKRLNKLILLADTAVEEKETNEATLKKIEATGFEINGVTSEEINKALEMSKEIKRLKKLILSADTAVKEKEDYNKDLKKIENEDAGFREISGLEKLLLTANAFLIENVGIAITKLSVLGVDISNPKTKEAMELAKIAEKAGDAKIVTARKEGEASIIKAEKEGEAKKMSATKLGDANIITATKQIEVKKLEVQQMEQEGKAEAVKLEKILNAKAAGYKKMYKNFDKKSDAFAASRTADGMGEFSKNGGSTLLVPTSGKSPEATVSVPAGK